MCNPSPDRPEPQSKGYPAEAIAPSIDQLILAEYQRLSALHREAGKELDRRKEAVRETERELNALYAKLNPLTIYLKQRQNELSGGGTGGGPAESSGPQEL